MTRPGHSDSQSASQPTGAPGADQTADTGGYTAEMAGQVGEAVQYLGERLRDPSIPHSVAEVEQVTRGFCTTVDGMAEGVVGITEWLRATGHAGALSGHAGAVAERLAHVGRELGRLADAVDAAQRA